MILKNTKNSWNKRKVNNKYNAKKTVVDEFLFDSMKEASRYKELKMLEKAGVIEGLKLQPKFKLTEKQKRSTGKTERARYYIADFEYIKDGKRIVEDTKGHKTDIYKLKNVLMFEKYGIEIFES